MTPNTSQTPSRRSCASAAQFRHAISSPHTSFLRLATALLATVFALVFAPAVAQAQFGTWTEVGGLSGRRDHAAAFDSTRGITVLFGGQGGTLMFGETWEWNGSTWSRRTSDTLPTRSGHAIAFDSLRGVTVLFGGVPSGSSTSSNETWVWNGTAWTQRVVAGPSPRNGHSMVYDSARNVTVLFGGFGTNYNRETWEWNGTVWTRRSITGPSARTSAALAYDSARGVVVLFGGSNGNALGETWEWNGTVWTQRIVSGPSPRSNHAMAYDPVSATTVLLGGQSGNSIDGFTYLAETWEWDGASWIRRQVTQPGPLSDHSMTYDSTRGAITLIGGWDGSAINGETWEWNAGAWTLRFPATPVRQSNPMAFDSARGVSVMFGAGTSGDQVSETWEWNGSVWSRRVVGGPRLRVGHKLVYDSARGVTVMFGGRFNVAPNFGSTDETWEWNGLTWTQRHVSGPSPRSFHAMAYDSARAVTVVFGGKSSALGQPGGESRETWEWNGNVWTQRSATGPPALYGHAMAYDSRRARTVLHGGITSTFAISSRTWEWDGSSWNGPLVTTPSLRADHAMAYDSDRGVTVLFGGRSSGSFNDTWDWNGATWTLRATNGPFPRGASGMAYDSARGAMFLFGGNNGSFSHDDSWEFRTTVPVSISTQPSAQTSCSGLTSSATFSIAAFGSGPLAFQWQRETSPDVWEALNNGVLLLPGGTLTATQATTRQLRVSMNIVAGFPPMRFRCIVTNALGASTSNPVTLTLIACPCALADVAGDSLDLTRNPSNSISPADLDAFIAGFIAGNAGMADIATTSTDTIYTPNGSVGPEDLNAFITSFIGGC